MTKNFYQNVQIFLLNQIKELGYDNSLYELVDSFTVSFQHTLGFSINFLCTEKAVLTNSEVNKNKKGSHLNNFEKQVRLFLNFLKAFAHKIQRSILKFYPYKLQIIQELYGDYVKRDNYARIILNRFPKTTSWKVMLVKRICGTGVQKPKGNRLETTRRQLFGAPFQAKGSLALIFMVMMKQ